jgi:uncharacterized protein YbaP (TraB family)
MSGQSGREMIRHLAGRLLVLLFVLLPAGVLAQSAPSNPALWRIRDGASTVYIFGSLHILPPSFNWRAPAVDAAIAASDIFVFEVPVDDEATARQKAFIVKNGLLPRGASLRKVLNRIEFETYSRILLGAGLKPEHFTRYRPWLATVIVGLAYVHRRDLTMLKGVDDEIIEQAQRQGKELRYLEAIEDQMKLLVMGDDLAQVKALKRQLVSLPQSISHTKDLVDTWVRGDADRFTDMIEGDFGGHIEAQDLLISNRNRAWVPTIEELLRARRTAMVTVGAAHIGGPKGLISLLCAAGQEVERIGTNGAADTRSCGPNS